MRARQKIRARRERGFTLTELMTVVVIVGVLAGLAVTSFRKSKNQMSVDNWSNAIRSAVIMASRRAITTGQPYMMTIGSRSINWCAVVLTSQTPPATSQTSCAGLPTGVEIGGATQAPDDAEVRLFADGADVAIPGQSYVAPARTPVTSTQVLYFSPRGTSDSNFNRAMGVGGAVPRGATIYVGRALSDDVSKRQKIVIYPLSSRPRIIGTY
jgi:prepilin-type N-terminal cleavage/methylation domain-containing protein